MSAALDHARRRARQIAAIALVVPLGFLARQPSLPAAERAELAARFRFERTELPDLPGATYRSSRPVHPSLARIAGWINTLGGAVALNDLDRDGLPNDVCWVETRSDRVLVAPVPGTGDRYAPFALDPSPLAYDPATTAPMGCVPCDMNEDGLVDLLVYYWGRPPIAFLCVEDPASRRPIALSTRSYVPVEVDDPSQRWYTNAATFADVDGDGHADLILGNYFQDGARILDANASGTEEMQDSMTRALNGGRNRLLLWAGAETGSSPSVRFVEARGAFDDAVAYGWTLAAGAADLDGDLLPEIYFANDFGSDRLLHNRSTPGHPVLAVLSGARGFTTPASKVLGHDSFKGMGVDFGDLNGDGIPDIYVSNITTEYGLQESQFAWVSTGEIGAMAKGIAPYVDASEELGLSRSGWAWDSRLADFDNDGVPEAMQALGFLKGKVDRWPELHEIAMGNDQLLRHPSSWHQFLPGDDLSGRTPSPFFVRASDGRYYDLARDVGLGDPHVSRGIALADVDGDGRIDFAVGNQWEASAFYRNRSPHAGAFLGLHLLLPVGTDGCERTLVAEGHPGAGLRGRAAIGARAIVHLPDGRRILGAVDGGSGHSGKRSHEVLLGLGTVPPETRLDVDVAWRDANGSVHRETFALMPGWHTLVLASPRSSG